MTTTYQDIVVERPVKDILTVRVNRPGKRNALSRSVLSEIALAFRCHAEDPEIKVAVLTAAGEKAFAAGGDLEDFESVRTQAEADALFRPASESLDTIRRFPVPTVAALNGIAVGGGAELALACDFRLAMPHAVIGFVQARLAITSGFGGGGDLMRLLGTGPGLLHMLRAKTLSAEEAQQLGLVDEVAEAEEGIESCVTRFIEPIRRNPLHVLRAIKSLAVATRSGSPAEDLVRIEREGFSVAWAHPDHWRALERAGLSGDRT